MSQTTQQVQATAAAKPGARKDWELFWRIIAALMLVVIAWIIWVLYQITPRTVVTPLAFESRAKSIGGPAAVDGAAATGAISPPDGSAPGGLAGAPAPQRSAEAIAADLAMEQAQAAARAGAHQASAEVQAAALEKAQEKAGDAAPAKAEGLKLSSEIATPPADRK